MLNTLRELWVGTRRIQLESSADAADFVHRGSKTMRKERGGGVASALREPRTI